MYQTAVELAMQHSEEICLAAAQLIHERKIAPYNQLPTAELSSRLIASLHMHLRYLQSGDLEEWRTFCRKIVTDRMAQGQEYTSVIQAGQCAIDALEQFFESRILALDKVNGMPAHKLLAALKQRLKGLSTVGTTAIMVVGMSNRDKPR
jgi:hypothetical protein